MKQLALKVTNILMFITGGLHSISLFFQIEPENEIQKQMFALVYTHKLESGAGFAPTFGDIHLALSSCFTILYFMTGVLNFYLLRQKLESSVWKGILLIEMIFFGAAFFMMLAFTFLPPVILTGLTFASLTWSWLKVLK